MTDDQLEAMKKAAQAATPQNLDSAEIINREPGLVDCPTCGGDGETTLADIIAEMNPERDTKTLDLFAEQAG